MQFKAAPAPRRRSKTPDAAKQGFLKELSFALKTGSRTWLSDLIELFVPSCLSASDVWRVAVEAENFHPGMLECLPPPEQGLTQKERDELAWRMTRGGHCLGLEWLARQPGMGAAFDATRPEAMEAIEAALEFHEHNSVRFWLDRGLPESMHAYVMHRAASVGLDTLVCRLLKLGASPDEGRLGWRADDDGTSSPPVHAALTGWADDWDNEGLSRCAKALLRAGADLASVDAEGRSGHERVAEVLLAHPDDSPRLNRWLAQNRAVRLKRVLGSESMREPPRRPRL